MWLIEHQFLLFEIIAMLFFIYYVFIHFPVFGTCLYVCMHALYACFHLCLMFIFYLCVQPVWWRTCRLEVFLMTKWQSPPSSPPSTMLFCTVSLSGQEAHIMKNFRYEHAFTTAFIMIKLHSTKFKDTVQKIQSFLTNT